MDMMVPFSPHDPGPQIRHLPGAKERTDHESAVYGVSVATQRHPLGENTQDRWRGP